MSRKDDLNKTRPSVSSKKRPNRLKGQDGLDKTIGKHGRAVDSSSSETKRLDFAELAAAHQAAKDLENERELQRTKVEEALSSTVSMEALVESIDEDDPEVVASEDETTPHDSLNAEESGDELDQVDRESELSKTSHETAEIHTTGQRNALDSTSHETSAVEMAESDTKEDPEEDAPDRSRRSKVSDRQKKRAEKKAASARKKRDKEEKKKAEVQQRRSADAANADPQNTYDAQEKSSPSKKAKKPIPPALKRRRRRGIILILIILLVASIAAASVAFLTFTSGINGKIALKDDDLSTVLVSSEEKEDPYYVMVEVEYNKTSRYYEGPGMIEVLRVDPANHRVTAISVPPNTSVPLSDGEYHSISEAQNLQGDAYLALIVGKFLSVDISHIIRIDAEGLQHIVDYFGGIQVDVPEVVDDPDAGDIYIDAGSQTLDGASTVVLTRADNFNDAVATRAANQNAVVEQLVKAAVEKSNQGYAKSVDALKNDFKTDMTARELKSLLKALSSDEGITFYSTYVPGELDVETQGKVYLASKSDLSKIMEAINNDGNPETVDENAIDKKSVFIEVRNGSGIEGGAVQARSVLQDDGWRVSFTSNADSDEYGETLVVYNEEEYESAANALVKSLGVGRVIAAGDNYEFGTDLLVIVGRDWKPQS